MHDSNERRLDWPLWFLLPASALWFLYLAFANKGFYGGADEVVHYWMSRYSWQHPLLFLDLWGKPLFTTLSSPFSQMGFEWLRVFNVLAGLTTAYIAFRILKEASVKHAWLGFILTLGAPVYFALLPSALTEVLFSLLLMLGVWGLTRSFSLWPAFLLSFLPFARNEGFVILIALVPWLIYRKKYAAIPLLLSGYLIFSLIGWLVFRDFLWLWHGNPYKGNPMYGSGELLHFVKEIPRSTGLIITTSAFIAWIVSLLPDDKLSRIGLRKGPIVILSLLGFVPYFAAHSYVWWAQAGNSLGLVRVLGAVSPLLSLPAAWLISALLTRLPRLWMQYSVAAVLVYFILIVPFRQQRPPSKANDINKLSLEAAQWLNNSEYSQRMLYFYDPTFLFYAGRDPYDKTKSWERLPNKQELSDGIPDGSIVVWDAHFGNNEGQTPRDKLLNDNGFKLIRSFTPPDTIYVLNGFPYEILILERIPND
jgi:hypothetical protein